MWDYSEKVKQHFFEPRNVGVLDDADAVGEVGSISCGDALKLFLKIEDERIVDARFQTFGCGSAIASSSALTEMVIGRSLDEALRLTNQDIADYLDGLPPEKMHCSVMGAEALRAAIASFRGEALDEDDHEDGALICNCFGIHKGMIERAVRVNRLSSVEAVTNFTKAGGACKTCHDKIEDVLAEILAEMSLEEGKAAAPAPAARPVPPARPAAAPAASAAAPATMTTLKKIQLISAAIDEMRPSLQRDGGDIELVDVDGDTVLVDLRGACVGCQMSSATLSGVQERLAAVLGRVVRVLPARAA